MTDPTLIERAAEAIFSQICKRNKVDFRWDELEPQRREDFRDDVRAALSAHGADEMTTLSDAFAGAWLYRIGDPVEKRSGSSWRGKVCGYYWTELTPRGYCVESAFERGSVQIYPEAALRKWEPSKGE